MNTKNDKLNYGRQIHNFMNEIKRLREYVEKIKDMAANEGSQTKKLKTELIPFVLRSNQHVSEEDKDKIPAKEIEKLEKRFGRKIEFEEYKDSDDDTRFRILWKNEEERKKSLSALDEIMNAIQFETRHLKITYELAFIKLITLVEWFLAQILRTHLQHHPEALDTISKTFSLDDLKIINSIDLVYDHLIDETITQITHGSIESWFEYLKGTIKNQKKEKSIYIKKTLNLDLEITDKYIPKLIEAHKRRNLLVHNNGIVNKVYVNNFPKDLEEEPPEQGKKISILPSYFEESIQNFELCFVIIGSEVMKKAPENLEQERVDLLLDCQYSSLDNKKFNNAIVIGQYIENDSEASEQNKLYATINRWLAIKYDTGIEKIKNEVEQVDFTSKAKLYKMAKALVLDDFAAAIPTIKLLLSRDNNKNKDIVKENKNIETLKNKAKKERGFVNKNIDLIEKTSEKKELSQQTLEATQELLQDARDRIRDLRNENFELDIDDLKEWPLFNNFRKSEKKLYRELVNKYNTSNK